MAEAAPLVVVVADYEIVDAAGLGFGRQHARYRLVITEAGAGWEVRRRWTELRITIDALRVTHPAALASPKVSVSQSEWQTIHPMGDICHYCPLFLLPAALSFFSGMHSLLLAQGAQL